MAFLKPSELARVPYRTRTGARAIEHAMHDATAQGHLRRMPCAPCSSYSALDIHSCWKEPSDARIEPPIHTAKRRSCAAKG